MLDLISDFGEWVISLVELVTGRIDPRLKAAWAYVAAAVGVIVPAFGAWRVFKIVTALVRGETPIYTDKDAEHIARRVVSETIDYDKLAEAIVRKQAALATSPVSEGDIAAAQRGIAHVAEVSATGDPEQRRIADALAAGNTELAVRLLGERLEAKARMGAAMNKEAAEAARGLAALKRLTSVAEAAALYRQAADLDPDGIETWADAADTAMEAGRLEQARRACEQGLAAAERAQDQWWRMALSNRLGDICVAEGALDEAMTFYGNGKDVADRLAKSDPGNAGWQRDLSVSQEKIGDVLVEQGNLPAALDSYKASLVISDRLAKSDPGNAGWQRDLSVSQEKIGDVLVEQGNLPAALDSYKASLVIRDRLAKSDPGNAGWQRDLALSFGRVAMVEARQGARQNALGGYRKARDIIARLKAASPDNATLPNDLAFYEARIAELDGR